MVTSTLVYNDDQIEVKTGIDLKQEQVQVLSTRKLSNAIKITGKSQNTRFIQFITNQVVDLYAYGQDDSVVQWEKVGPNYMDNNVDPCWKLDVVDDAKSIYYEKGGAHKETQDGISMYDEPGGRFAPIEQRTTACTFVVLNNKVTHLVKWSIQVNKDKQQVYCVEVKPQNYLSKWVKDLLNKRYKELCKNSDGYEEIIQSKQDKEELVDSNGESCNDFLRPPSSWITCAKFPTLFPKGYQFFEEKPLEGKDGNYKDSQKSEEEAERKNEIKEKEKEKSPELETTEGSSIPKNNMKPRPRLLDLV